MYLPDWRDWCRSLWNPRPQRRRRHRHSAASPRLGLTPLAERRVLNGGAVVVIALTATTNGQDQNQDAEVVVIDTGSADGSADVFEVVRGEADGKDLLQVEVNGSVVYSTDF